MPFRRPPRRAAAPAWAAWIGPARSWRRFANGREGRAARGAGRARRVQAGPDGLERLDHTIAIGRRYAIEDAAEDVALVAAQGLEGALPLRGDDDVHDAPVVAAARSKQVAALLQQGDVAAHRRQVDAKLRRQRPDRGLGGAADRAQSLELFQRQIAAAD